MSDDGPSPEEARDTFWASYNAIRESLRSLEDLDDPWGADSPRLLAELKTVNDQVGRALRAAALAAEPDEPEGRS